MPCEHALPDDALSISFVDCSVVVVVLLEDPLIVTWTSSVDFWWISSDVGESLVEF